MIFPLFRAAQCQSNTPFRNVHHLQVTRKGRYVIVDIQANAFFTPYGAQYCRKPNRNRLRQSTGRLDGVAISKKDRTLAAPTAKAEGLYLVNNAISIAFSASRTPVGTVVFRIKACNATSPVTVSQ